MVEHNFSNFLFLFLDNEFAGLLQNREFFKYFKEN